MSQEPKNTIEDWDDCPEGAISQLVSRSKSQDRRRFLVRASAGSGTLIVLLGLIAFAALGTNDPPRGSGHAISCGQVLADLPEYLDGRLSLTTRKQIEQHLDDCPHCRKERERLEAESRGPNTVS